LIKKIFKNFAEIIITFQSKVWNKVVVKINFQQKEEDTIKKQIWEKITCQR